MFERIKKKAIAKSRPNIDIILRNLVPICQALEAEIEANGGNPVTSGPAFDQLLQQRKELFFQLNGPMSMDDVRAYVEPLLARQSTPNGVRLAVESTIEEQEELLRS